MKVENPTSWLCLWSLVLSPSWSVTAFTSPSSTEQTTSIGLQKFIRCFKRRRIERKFSVEDSNNRHDQIQKFWAETTEAEDTVSRPFVDSPLSQIPWSNDDDHEHDSRRFPLHHLDDEWLEMKTSDILDETLYPLGSLTEKDMELIENFMAAWARRRSSLATLMVERLLKRVVDDMRARNPVVRVNARFYTLAIEAWARSRTNGSAKRAQDIHTAMVKMYNETGDPLIAPSVESYNALLNAWEWSGDANAARYADDVLVEMIESFKGGNIIVKPDALSFFTVLNTYSKSSQLPSKVRRCEELFEMMDELAIRRNIFTFSAMQNVYARSGTPDAPLKTRRVLQKMIDLSAKGDIFAKPNCVHYNVVLGAYSKTPSILSAQEASDMLDLMERPTSEGGYDVEPDRFSYAVTILACCRCPDVSLGIRLAIRNLLRLEKRAELEARRRDEVSSAAPPAVFLDAECFNVVLTALSRANSPDALMLALDIVDRMKRYADQGQTRVTPNIRSWNAVLNTIAKSAAPKNHTMALKAEEIFYRISEEYQSGASDARPNAFTFAAVLNAYQRINDTWAAQRADSFVRRMEKLYQSGASQIPPDVFHYTIVCGAWASVGATERCLQIIKHMYDRDAAGHSEARPNVRTYNAALHCLVKSGDADRAEQLLYHMIGMFNKGDKSAMPNTFSFNTVIVGFCKCKRKGSGRRAESVLDRFLEFEEENPKVKPDSRSFTNIIAHWCSKSSKELDAPYRAEYMLNRMLSFYKEGRTHLAPNMFAVTSVMDGYARANHADAGRNAERLLKVVDDLVVNHSCPDLEISTEMINCVIFAWASSGDDSAAQKAESHLDEMESRGGRLQPDSKSYGYTLLAWSKSSSHEKAMRALSILRRMETQQRNGNTAVVVDEHAYSLVINACAFCNGGSDIESEAFEIATSLFNDMLLSPHFHPSSLTYGWFIQACGRLRVKESRRIAAVEKAFSHCSKNGLVNDFVLNRLKGATSESQFTRLLRKLKSPVVYKQKLTFAGLPDAWKVNCKAR